MSLPLVHRFPAGFSIADAFRRLCDLPRCLWLDSAAPGPGGDEPLGRYSFLSADPVARLDAFAGQSNSDNDPWPLLRRWAAAMPSLRAEGLPPFQGGIAGLWGYEAGSWLEDVGLAAIDDFPTPAVSVGVYDWVICSDAVTGAAWLISQGFRDETFARDEACARRRLESVLDRLAEEPAGCREITPTELREPAGPNHPTLRPGVTANFTSEGYRSAVAEIVDRIHRGDSFQVNLAQRLITRASCDPVSLYFRLRSVNPAPMAGYYDGGPFQVAASSPEGFLRLRDGIVETRPIKGTTKRTGDPAVDEDAAQQLLASDKERAENVMIVDLMRNDLSRVCEDDSVEVTQLCGVEQYAFVQHLVSVIRGRLRREVTPIDLLAACFPGGSITGAPKIEAMRTIAALEPHRRGPYCGSLGYVSCSGDAEFNILIRTITASGGWWLIPVGGGITAGSVPASEEQETWIKAEGLLRAATGGMIPE